MKRPIESNYVSQVAYTRALEAYCDEQEQCKYGQEPKSCTSNPMDCQCALDAALAQPERCNYPNCDYPCMNLPDCQEQEQGEPVAWMRQDGQRVTTASDRHNYPDYETRYSIPLYTTPYVPTGRQQRKPLTDEQIADTFCKAPHQTQQVAWFAAGVRYAEAAHGIKE